MSTASQHLEPNSATLAWIRGSGWSGASIAPLSGDVSLRRYYRLQRDGGQSAVLVTYPEAILDACSRFADISELLTDRGIRVPTILAVDCDHGRMLLEDLGTETLYDRRDRGWEYLGPRLSHAADMIVRIAELPADRISRLNPPLDAALMASELSNTWKVALGAAGLADAGLPLSLEVALESMLEHLGHSPQTPCHRDFMARNLLPLDEAPELCVLDFQDLRVGPHTYDLASLLNDSLYPPEELEETILASSLRSPADRLNYHRSAAQRTLKIVGTFLGFSQRGFVRHLRLIEPTLDRARRHLRLLPELASAGPAIDQLANALLSPLGAG